MLLMWLSPSVPVMLLGGCALALVIPVWAAILAVAFASLLLAGALGAVAVGALRRGGPPVPEQAIRELAASLQVQPS